MNDIVERLRDAYDTDKRIEAQELGHWVAAPMKDVGTCEQFHEVVDRAAHLADQIIYLREQIERIRKILDGEA